jgi:hypothetical protein
MKTKKYSCGLLRFSINKNGILIESPIHSSNDPEYYDDDKSHRDIFKFLNNKHEKISKEKMFALIDEFIGKESLSYFYAGRDIIIEGLNNISGRDTQDSILLKKCEIKRSPLNKEYNIKEIINSRFNTELEVKNTKKYIERMIKKEMQKIKYCYGI